jgi:ADP-heptose:LPS heptosyltransferase
MSRLLISRLGAFGDVLHASHLPRLLKESGKYSHITFETNIKGHKILYNNPYIDELVVLDDAIIVGKPMGWLHRHWDMMADGFDEFINLFESIEYELVAMESQNSYFRDDEWRRENYSHINYFDAMSKLAGLSTGHIGEVHFDNTTENDVVKKYLSKYTNRYTVLINIAGSSPQKRFVHAEAVAKGIYDMIPNALVITTGDKESADLDFRVEDSRSIVGKWGFRQAMCLSQYVNLVISFESGLPIASQMFGTPTIQLMTTSSLENHVQHVKNAYGIQSPVYCSPCNRGPYKFLGCPKTDGGYPKCIDIPTTTILEKVREAYDN